MKILGHPFSTYTRRVRIAALEKSLDLELQVVDMANREHRGEAFKALNPYGRVPVLADGDFVLYESTAILSYLEARFPEPALLPESPEDRALVDMHMKLCDNQMGRHIGTSIFPRRFLPEERWNKDAIAEAETEIKKHLAVLERQLDGRRFLVAEQFTLADICYMPFLHFLPLMEIEPGPNVGAWSTHLLARESAAATVPGR